MKKDRQTHTRVVIAFSEALHRKLELLGIDVTVINRVTSGRTSEAQLVIVQRRWMRDYDGSSGAIPEHASTLDRTRQGRFRKKSPARS
jgi:hypothetical protein